VVAVQADSQHAAGRQHKPSPPTEAKPSLRTYTLQRTTTSPDAPCLRTICKCYKLPSVPAAIL
jgi:hypothetical protein